MATVVSREHALRFSFMAVAGLLFLGANSAWTGLGYLNPLAWFLEWSSVVLAFLCIYAALRTKVLTKHIYGYLLIAASIVISAASYYPSIVAPSVHVSIAKTINPYYFLVLLIPILLLPLLMYYDQKNLENKKMVPLLFFLSVIGSMGVLLVMFYRIGSAFPTDESVFDMYSAHLFLQGQNPYNPALISNAFSFYHFEFKAFDPITPLTTGGYVNTLTYPALSFLIFIPAVILHLKASAIMVPVLLAPLIIVWYRGWSKGQWIKSSYALLPFIALMLYAYQGASADTDALWASLLMLSYFVLPRHKSSGVLFGLALSVKQFPVIVAPFLLYFIYREYGKKKTLKWLLSAAIAFLAINGYFIFMNPEYWFSSMVANELAPLIGIGFGIPQISFAGILGVPKIYFTIIMVDTLLASFAIYVLKYQKMKFALFAFPVIVFIFNYRLFPQYLYYWLILSIIPMLDLMNIGESSEKKPLMNNKAQRNGHEISHWKAISAVLIAIILASVALGYHEGVQKNPGNLVVNSVGIRGYNSSGYADNMNINITYHGNMGQIPVYFRVFSEGAIVNGNMFQWVDQSNMLLQSGHTYNLTITPQYQDYSVNASSGFMVVAYYNNIQGSYYFK